MTITQRVARKVSSGDYNMDYFTFEIKTDDLPQSLFESISPVEEWRILMYVAQRECINWQLQSGYMELEVAQIRMEYIRRCLGEKLAELVVKHGL
jgi:hypothetical protein